MNKGSIASSLCLCRLPPPCLLVSGLIIGPRMCASVAEQRAPSESEWIAAARAIGEAIGWCARELDQPQRSEGLAKQRACPWCGEPCAQAWCGACERMLPAAPVPEKDPACTCGALETKRASVSLWVCGCGRVRLVEDVAGPIVTGSLD